MGATANGACISIFYVLLFSLVMGPVYAAIISAPSLSMTPSPFYLPGNAIDVGSPSIIANTLISGGSGAPYYGNWIITPPASSGASSLGLPLTQLPAGNVLALTINAISSNTMQFGFNGIAYSIESTGSNTVYGGWTIEAYAQDSSGVNSTTSNRVLTVYSALSISVSATESTITQGQSSTLTGIASGGTGAANYSFQWYESFDNGAYSAIKSATSNTLTFSTNSSTQTGNYSFKLQLTDLGTANKYSINSTAVTIELKEPDIVITHVGVLQNVSYYGFPPIAYVNSTGADALTPTTYSEIYELAGYKLKNMATNAITTVAGYYLSCFASSGVDYTISCNQFPMNDTPPGTYEISLYIYNYSDRSESFYTNYSAPFTVKIGTPGMLINGPSNTVYNGTGTRVYYTLLDYLMQLNGTVKLNGNAIKAIASRPALKNFSTLYEILSTSVNPAYPDFIYVDTPREIYLLNASSMSIIYNTSSDDYGYLVGGDTGNYEYAEIINHSIGVLNPLNLSLVGTINLTGTFMGAYAINGTIYALVQNSTSNGVEIINASTYKTIGYVPVPDRLGINFYPYPTYASKQGRLIFLGEWGGYMHMIYFYPSNDSLSVSGSPLSDDQYITYYSNVTDKLYFISGYADYSFGMFAINESNSKESQSIQNIGINEFKEANSPDWAFTALQSSDAIYSSGQYGMAAFDVLNNNSYFLSNACHTLSQHIDTLSPKNTNVLIGTNDASAICNITAGSTVLKAAGTYNLTLSTTGDQNYTANTISALFTIAKATPTLQLHVCSNYTYNGSAGCLIIASINSFGNQLKGNLYINGNLVANSTHSADNLTFIAHEAAGSYSIVFNTTGNANYTSSTIGGSFSIAKATPKITFPNFQDSFIYNGSKATVEAEIYTYNNQLQANAFVNNALVSSFYSSNDFAVGPAAGNYTITANTLGNENYTAASVSRILTIYPAPVHPSSISTLYITDNVNKTYASNRSVFDVYLINYSDNAKVLNITYYQNQLPAEISFPAHYYVRFNFACAFTANGNYYVSNNTYGLLDSVPCGTNYTITGGSYDAYYSKRIIPTTTTTTTTTTTVTTTTLPSISITNKGYEVSLNIAPHERSKITITQLHIALNIYSNYTKNITEDVTIKNVTSTMSSVPIGYHAISGFNISATPKVPAINTTVTYACSLNPSQIKPLMFVNGTWMPVTDYSINQSACSIAFFASTPAVVAVATTQNITTTIPATTATTTILPVAKPTPNYEEYAIIVVIVILAIIIIAYAAMKAREKGHPA